MPTSVRTRKILLSDAARSYLDIEAAFLRRSGFEVMSAIDGPALLRMIETESPELCILDLSMPGLPGDEVVKRVRAATGRDGGPAFILVSAGGNDSFERCLASGADEVVTEPFSKEEFLKKAAALLRIPRRAHARMLLRFEVEGERAARIPFFGSSINLSKGGVLLESLEKVADATEIRMGFFLPGYPTRISCRGAVVRQEAAEGGFMRYGVRFTEITDADSQAIDEFVKRRE
ncbi:MAG: response regulator [Acidobacteriota bacterium]